MKAINYDLSVERYNGDTGAYSLGLFYKDIENFLYRSSSSNIRDGTSGGERGPGRRDRLSSPTTASGRGFTASR